MNLRAEKQASKQPRPRKFRGGTVLAGLALTGSAGLSLGISQAASAAPKTETTKTMSADELAKLSTGVDKVWGKLAASVIDLSKKHSTSRLGVMTENQTETVVSPIANGAETRVEQPATFIYINESVPIKSGKYKGLFAHYSIDATVPYDVASPVGGSDMTITTTLQKTPDAGGTEVPTQSNYYNFIELQRSMDGSWLISDYKGSEHARYSTASSTSNSRLASLTPPISEKQLGNLEEKALSIIDLAAHGLPIEG